MAPVGTWPVLCFCAGERECWDLNPELLSSSFQELGSKAGAAALVAVIPMASVDSGAWMATGCPGAETMACLAVLGTESLPQVRGPSNTHFLQDVMVASCETPQWTLWTCVDAASTPEDECREVRHWALYCDVWAVLETVSLTGLTILHPHHGQSSFCGFKTSPAARGQRALGL